MSEGISAPFIRYPIGTSLMMAGILFVGLVAYPLLPVAPLPQVDFPTIQVSASLPGGSPETMASSVAQPLERQACADSRHRADDLDQLSRYCRGHHPVRSQPLDRCRRQRRAGRDQCRRRAVAQKLPSPPTYRKVNPADSPILLLSATSDTLPLTTVSDAVDASSHSRSARSPVSPRSSSEPAEARDPHPDRSGQARRQGLSMEDVRSQIAITTVDSPKGNIDGATRAYTIYANDQLLDSKDWNDVIIAYRNGGPLRIRDIGQAVTGPEDAKTGGLGQRQARCVPGGVQTARCQRHRDRRQDQGHAAAAGRRDPALDQDRGDQRPHPDHPRRGGGRAIHPAPDHCAGRDGDLHLPAQLLGHGHSNHHVPLALLGACALMWVFGYSLDNLSLMALTIAVGFVVDDAIVMLENITRYIEEGEKPMAAAFKGASEIGFTIVSISISLVAVLIPLR